MRARPVATDEIRGECQVASPSRRTLCIRGEILQAGKHKHEGEIYRLNPQCPPNIKLGQVDPPNPVVFENHQPGDQKSANDEKEANPEVPIKQPPERRPECSWETNGENAMCTKNQRDTDRPPTVKMEAVLVRFYRAFAIVD